MPINQRAMPPPQILSPAELTRAIEQAEADRIPTEELAGVVEKHRGGCDEAARQLNRAFMFLVWECYLSFRERKTKPDEVLGTWGERLAVIIDALRRNDLPAAKLEGRIRTGLRRATRSYFAEIDRVLSDPGKRAKRAEKGRATDVAPWTDEFADSLIDELAPVEVYEDPTVAGPRFTPGGKPYRRPSRFRQLMPADEAVENETRARELAEADRLEPFVQTPTEAAVISFIRDPSKLPPNIAHAHILTAIDRLRERADREGVPGTSGASGCDCRTIAPRPSPRKDGRLARRPA